MKTNMTFAALTTATIFPARAGKSRGPVDGSGFGSMSGGAGSQGVRDF